MSAHSPEPWSEDDGNIFSDPLSEQRMAAIMRRLDGEDIPHPDEECKPDPLGFVCSVGQNRDNFEADADRIVACVNALAGIPTEALEAGALAKVLEITPRLMLLGRDAGTVEKALAVADTFEAVKADGLALVDALRALGRLA